MEHLKSQEKNDCREKMSELLRKRIAFLDEEIAMARNVANGQKQIECGFRRMEAQLILNTVLLGDF